METNKVTGNIQQTTSKTVMIDASGRIIKQVPFTATIAEFLGMTEKDFQTKCQFNGTECSKVSTITTQIGTCIANPCDGGCLAYACLNCCADYKNNNLPWQ
tara:strand:+ start:289 stop:591 length:303 start_codon:yes stop_codon:yes gene_type:complete